MVEKAVLEFRRTKPHEGLTKEKFAPLLKTVVNARAKPQIIQNGFQASGIFPWTSSAIDFTKYLGL